MFKMLQTVAALTTSVAGASSRLHKIEVSCWEIDGMLGNPHGVVEAQDLL